MISAPLTTALRARRELLNEKFRAALSVYPRLEADEVLRFVADCVDPLIVAVSRHDAEAVGHVLEVAYDCTLQLLGHRVMAGTRIYQAISQGWQQVFPAAAALVSVYPERLIPAVSNALYQLANNEQADVALWIAGMYAVAETCARPEDWLVAGQLLAWQAGNAHYREGALAAMTTLPPTVTAEVLGVNVASLPDVVERLRSDRWFHPRQAVETALRVVRHVGAFRGLGGVFLQPPRVASAPDGWLVRSGTSCWLLVADAFGATLYPAQASEWDSAAAQSKPVGIEHVGDRLIRGKETLAFTNAGAITSLAVVGDAAACTFSSSFGIALIAWH